MSSRQTRWMRIVLAVLTGGLLQAGPALAQQEEPIGPFVVDVRGAFMTLAPSDGLAATFGLEKAQLPSRAIGVDLGVHVYPIRGRVVALGVGASVLLTRGSKKPAQPAEEGATLDPTLPTVRTKITALTPQVSLNFGSRRGYSYVSAGIGTMSRTIEATEGIIAAETDDTRARTLNYGGGARWFASTHVAFTFDVRWYRVAAQEGSVTSAALPQQRLFVGSVGISIH